MSPPASRAAQLCDRFGYPAELETVLQEATELAGKLLQPLAGIVISPSASTGDFVWSRRDGRVRLFSDIDGFVFSDASTPAKERFRLAMAELARRASGEPFRIDLPISPIRALRRIPPSYQMAETALAGFVLCGEGALLGHFPRHFDPRSSRHAFLLNLSKPLRTLTEAPPSLRPIAWARLMLDIPLLAASESQRCIPGHRARARWFLDDPPPGWEGHRVLAEAIEAAIRVREEPLLDPFPAESAIGPAIRTTVHLLDREGPPPDDPDAALVTRLSRWLPPRSPRRLAAELRTVSRRPTGLASDLRWLSLRKEAVGGSALLGLLSYVLGDFNGPPPPGISGLLGCYARATPPGGSGDSFLRSANRIYASGLYELYPSLRPRALEGSNPSPVPST